MEKEIFEELTVWPEPDCVQLIRDAKPVVGGWKESLTTLSMLAEKAEKLHDNAVLDIMMNLAVDNCFSDMESDLSLAEGNSELLMILNGLSDHVHDCILACAAEGGSGINKQEALFSLCKSNRVRRIVEQMDKLLSDMDELMQELCRTDPETQKYEVFIKLRKETP